MKRLRELRKEVGATLQQVSNEVHTSSSELSKFERGAREPNLALLNKLANYYDVSVDYLLERTDDRKPNRKEKVSSEPEEVFMAPLLKSGYGELTPRNQQRVVGYVHRLREEELSPYRVQLLDLIENAIGKEFRQKLEHLSTDELLEMLRESLERDRGTESSYDDDAGSDN